MTVTIPCRGARGSLPRPSAVIITAGFHTVGVRRGSAHQTNRLGARCTVPKSSRTGELPELSAEPAGKVNISAAYDAVNVYGLMRVN